jgi:ion channel
MPLRTLPQFWKSDWHLTLVLVLLALEVFVLYPLSSHSRFGGIAVQVFFSFILISGAALVARRRAIVWFASVFAVGTAAVGWLRLFVPQRPLTVTGISMWIGFFAMLAAVLLSRVFGEGKINLHRIQGAIAVYLLIGIIWSGCYRLVLEVDPVAFNMPAVSDEGTQMSRLLYFSFVTLTTVGYGDLTPLAAAARSLAMVEALLGQLFPAILIGRLVSLEVSHREHPGASK